MTRKCAKCKKSCCQNLIKQIMDHIGRPIYNVCAQCHLRIFLIGRYILNHIIWKPGSRFVLRQFAELEDNMIKKS